MDSGGGAGRDRPRPAGRPRAGHRRGARREPGHPAERGRDRPGGSRRRGVRLPRPLHPRARQGERVVRAAASRPHPPLHPGPAAARDRAGLRRPTSCASSSPGSGSIPTSRAEGPGSLDALLGQLEGFEAAASAWEGEILPARMKEYDPSWLDGLCLAGRWVWGRGSGAVVGRLPALRAGARDPHRAPRRAGASLSGGRSRPPSDPASPGALGGGAGGLRPAAEPRRLLLRRDRPRRRAPPYPAGDGARRAGRLGSRHLGQLHRPARPADARPQAAVGRPLRAGAEPVSRCSAWRTRAAGRCSIPLESRWSESPSRDAVETAAWTLLRRYGVVFRKLLERETLLPPWRELLLVFRRLEARGEIRGGRFVDGFSGEQYALTEAVGQLRALRKQPRKGTLVSVSAADPLNLVGIATPGDRLARPRRQPPPLPGRPPHRRPRRPRAPLPGGRPGQRHPLAGPERPGAPERGAEAQGVSGEVGVGCIFSQQVLLSGDGPTSCGLIDCAALRWLFEPLG